MKKFLSLTTALVLCMGAVSCGKKSSESKKKSSAVTAPLFTYKSADIDMADSFDVIQSIDRDMSSGDILVFGKLGSGVWSGYITSSDFSDYSEFSFTPAENENVLGAALCSFGKKAVLTHQNGSVRIHIIGSDGTEKETLDCGINFSNGSFGDVMGSIYPCGEGFVISNNSGSVFYTDGSGVADEIGTKGMDVYGISGSGDGGVTLLLSGSDKSVSLASVNEFTVGDIQDCGSLSSSALTMCPGMGEYSYAAVLTDGLYGLKDNQWVMLSDFVDVPFDAINVLDIVMTAENEFAVLAWTNSGMTMYLLTERDISVLKNKKVVKIAAVSDLGYISNLVREYNEAHEDGDYRIELVNYNYQGDNGESASDLLKMDLISGNAPDLITYPLDGINLNGYYMDLYEFMDKDSDISREDFIPNILEAISVDGKLPYIIPTFEVHTMTAKTKFPFVKENWSYDEFIEAYEAMPEGMELMYDLDKSTMIHNFEKLVNIYDFIDYEKAECRFDSPQFAHMLNFVRDNHIGMTSAESNEYDPGEISYSDPMWISQDKVLIPGTYIPYFQSIWTSVSYFDDDVTFAGLPSLNGTGSYVTQQSTQENELSIPRNAQNPEGAWDFIKFFFSDQGYTHHRLAFPIYQEHFDKTADHCLENDPGNEDLAYLPDDGWITAVRYTNPEGTEYEILDPLTEDELKQYKEFVYSAAKRYCRTDNTVYSILFEELDEFFNSDKPAEETAAMIQNRVSIYLSETYD